MSKILRWSKNGAGLIGICLVVAAQVQVQAQDVVAGRPERERRASQVMVSPVAPSRSVHWSHTAAEFELAVFRETEKRLREVEESDPKRALEEYRRFLLARTPSAAVGIEAALKVVAIRERLKDTAGALHTCDWFAKKYDSEVSSVRMVLQKALILGRTRHLVEASQCIEDAMPKLLQLGPDSYEQSRAILLHLAQLNLDLGDSRGRHRAGSLYVNVEQVYLQWLKVKTPPHSWQLFEELQSKYSEAGQTERARQLLPKVADCLLSMVPAGSNPEGADASVMASRWLFAQGKEREAHLLLAKQARYSNSYVSKVAIIDQAQQLIFQQRYDDAKILLLQNKKQLGQSSILEVTCLTLLAEISYKTGNWTDASRLGEEALLRCGEIEIGEADKVSLFANLSQTYCSLSRQWLRSPILLEVSSVEILGEESAGVPFKFSVFLNTPQPLPLTVASQTPGITASVQTIKESHGYFSRHQVDMEVAPGELSRVTQAILKVQSAQFPDQLLTIPILNYLQTGVKVTPSVLFLGKIERPKKVEGTFYISAPRAFRILAVESDDTGLHITANTSQLSSNHLLNFDFLPDKTGHFYSGVVRVRTDLPGKEVIEVPYSARVK